MRGERNIPSAEVVCNKGIHFFSTKHVVTWFRMIEDKGCVVESVIFSVVVFRSMYGEEMVVKGNNVNFETKCCHAWRSFVIIK